MAYIVNKTDGNIAAVVNDGTLSTVTSIKLVGIGYQNYAETIAENLVQMLENFAHIIPPTGPLPGQIWFNKNTSHLQIYDGVMFKEINNTAISNSAPINARTGDFWFNNITKQLFFYRNGNWQVIAPAYPASMKATELVAEGLTDLGGNVHPAVTLYVDGSRMAIISKDPSYMPIPYVEGFTNVNPGINLIEYPGYRYSGIVDYAGATYGLLPDADVTYMHANADTSTVGTLSVINDGGIAIGANGDVVISSMVASPYTFGSSITSAADKSLALVGYGGGTLVMDNATNWISINKTNPTVDLDVGGSINADETITSQGGYYFADDSAITSSGGVININAGGTNAISADTAGNVNITGATHFGSDITVQSGNLSISDGQISIVDYRPAQGPWPGYYDSAWPEVKEHAVTKHYADSLTISNMLPYGSIIMWYGEIVDVPAGWRICNGLFGTPNLTDKFVMGAGGQAALGTVAGQSFSTVTTNTSGAHTHTGTTVAAGSHDHSGTTGAHALTPGEIANHQHTFNDVYALQDDANPPLYDRNGNRVFRYSSWGDDGDNDSGSPAYFESITDSAGASDPHNHPISSDGIHTHTLTIDQTAAHLHTITNFDNRPSFMALYYIMKVANELIVPLRPLGY